MKNTKFVVILLGLGLCLTACGKQTTTTPMPSKQEKESSKIEQVKETEEIVQEESEPRGGIVEVEPIEVHFDNNYYEVEIDGKLQGNNLTVKVKHTNDYTLDGYSTNLSDEGSAFLASVFKDSLTDIEKSAVLELDLMNIVAQKEYHLLYFDYWFGDEDTKIVAKDKLQEINSDYDKVVKNNIEDRYIAEMFDSEAYNNATLDERKQMALDLLEDLCEKEIIQDYNKNPDSYMISYTDAYGYDNGIMVKEFDSMMN